MSKRQALILGGLVIIAVAEVVKVNDLTAWHQLVDVKIFFAWMSGAATTVVAFLLKSDGHAVAIVTGAPEPTPPPPAAQPDRSGGG